MKRKLEICCYSIEAAILAAQCGADRVELCDNFSEGGTTPSFGSIQYAVEQLPIPVNVMVRPRGGDFLYSPEEYSIMKLEVQQIKKIGANGVVVGFLKADGTIDLDKTQEIVELAAPLEVTFHRAFDMCRDPFEALEQLIELGVSRILSSGTRVNVVEGMDMLAQLVEKANNRIIVMPGCGVAPENIKELLQKTRAIEIHTASKQFVPSSMDFLNPYVSMGGVASVDEYQRVSLDVERVKAILSATHL